MNKCPKMLSGQHLESDRYLIEKRCDGFATFVRCFHCDAWLDYLWPPFDSLEAAMAEIYENRVEKLTLEGIQ